MLDDEDACRVRAEALLRLAAGADNMKERGRLIDEAMRWHTRALDAHEHSGGWIHDDESLDDEAPAVRFGDR
jgi:hypothetical protein